MNLADSRGRTTALVLILAIGGLTAALVLAATHQHARTDRAERVHAIAAGLRCPVCQDLSVADSPAPLAGEMRRQIGDQLAAGRSPEQIRQGFVASYGESVLMSPPHRGVARLAYLLPELVVGAGVLGAVVALRRWRRAPPVPQPSVPTTPDVEDRARVAAALDRLLREEP